MSEPALAGAKVDWAKPAQTGMFGEIVCVRSTYFARFNADSYNGQRPGPSAARLAHGIIAMQTVAKAADDTISLLSHLPDVMVKVPRSLALAL